MDMFMDKLAQRLTAQEIIKANNSADVEEMNRLRGQVAEYNNCLAKLQQLIEEGAARIQGAQVNSGEIDRLVEESIAKIQAIQQDTAGLEQLQQQLIQRMDEADRRQGERLSSVNRMLDEKLDGVDQTLEERLENVDRLFEQRLARLQQQLESSPQPQLSEQLEEQLRSSEENVHKECVKVYRNVQAVVTEESGKQAESLAETNKRVEKLNGRLTGVLVVAIAALISSAVSAVAGLLGLMDSAFIGFLR